MGVGKRNSMSIILKKSIFYSFLDIAGNSDSTMLLRYLKENLGEEFNLLMDQRGLVYSKNLEEVLIEDQFGERTTEIVWRDGKNMYFLPGVGWKQVHQDEVALYKLNYDWLVRRIMDALDIADRHTPKEIIEDSIWALGQHRIEKQTTNIIVVRNIKNATTFDCLINHLNNHHNARNTALVIALDQSIPDHLSLPNQNELIRINEAIKWDKDNFELNTALLAGRMGGTITKPGFSNGYRTLISHGKTYEFTPKQSEALEFMDNESKPVHQTEILSHTTSHQGTKLRELFKGKGGKVHDAWNVIIKSDRKGNYWLDY